ncbi:Proliferating cell nuclear antigen, PCNA [Haladaptatus paucihalophilus DX253]|uniref:DNA polymerase sliding clamp n=1 Tax=Haladaptatus paucihalophilus DX253 TaxID=797209 RepID=E7QUE9_HALPU|nr:DNA polymerase sliding clamp [Haladaptatus paucihalophilus]EFW92228.1 Proliferating cell nuclear antigen, PCNA [Haladaptatus paucihalophilus DX253]SHK92446.1 monomeric archaeal DNA polymerase sliding clamp [Haladaptatus paucihalophilus DX253]
MDETGTRARQADAGDQLLHVVVDAETIQTTVALVDALVDECHLYFDEDGIRIPAMDPATVAAVNLTLGRSAFEAYETEDAHIGVDLSRLGDIVGMADRGQLLSFTLDSETRKLEIRIGELTYALALLDPGTVRSPPEATDVEFEFTGSVVTESGELSRAVKAADMVSNHVTLGIDEERDSFYAEATGDTDDVSLAVPADELVDFSPGDAHSLFSIDYLRAIDRAMPKTPEVNLELGIDIPLAVRYPFADGAGSVEYLVSPRIAAN